MGEFGASVGCWIYPQGNLVLAGYTLCGNLVPLRGAGYTLRGISYFAGHTLCGNLIPLRGAGYTLRGIWYLLDILCVGIWCLCRALDIPSGEYGTCWIYSVWEFGTSAGRWIYPQGNLVLCWSYSVWEFDTSAGRWIYPQGNLVFAGYTLCGNLVPLQGAGYTLRRIWYLLAILCVGIWCLCKMLWSSRQRLKLI